jgi:hypothetical protein
MKTGMKKVIFCGAIMLAMGGNANAENVANESAI